MKNSLKHLIALAIVFVSLSSNAQNYLGIHSSNYAGVMGTDLQPASFVDGRFLTDINLGSFNFNAYQNLTSFDTKPLPKWWIKSFKNDVNTGTGESEHVLGGSNPYNDWSLPDSTFMDRFLDSIDYNESGTYGVYNNIQIDVLNFMFHVKPTIAIGFTAKLRSITNVDDIDPNLAYLSLNSLDVPNLWATTFNEQLLNVNHMTWMEYGFVYSQVIKDDGEHFMKGGGKAKWLSGYTAAYVHTKNFDYNLLNKDTTSYLKGDFSYGHSNGILEEEESSGLPKSASKFGLGLDLGFVYEWRPDWEEYKYDMDGETNIWRRDKEKYKLRVGASILDIGGVKFEKGGLSRDFNVNTSNLFDLGTFEDASGLEGFDEIVDSLILNDAGWTSNNDEGTFFMGTPTALSLQVDYHIWKHFYVNMTGMLNLRSKNKPHHVKVANQLSITPSFDYAWAGFSIPVSINKYSGFKAGIATRLGPLTIGVTDFRALFAVGKVRGAEVYAGLRVPILYSHPSDIDGDKVSDEVDDCKTVPGIWSFKGCPDTDGDGIRDTEDECPNEPGLAEFSGCPDRDTDGIPDKDDECPDLPGDRVFNGCPDSDNDSIVDPKDECPDVPGIAKFNGCPDTDGDGIKDSEDACPDVAGPLINNGCPDTDGDGLFDFIDNCPTDFGPKENNGCPWPDTDGDGLLDKDDKCPNLVGPLENEGCPYQDTDGDGVLDKEDKCPATPGPVENEGCPVIEEEVQEILKTAFDNLEFETGKNIIKEESLPSLTELAEVLVKKTDWKLQIAGHTDNVGAAQSNLVLSKRRAEAVRAFMESKSVSIERLSVLYFGETEPVADNATNEGRQKNRRVEMTIIFE